MRFRMRGDLGTEYRRLTLQAGAEFKPGGSAVRGAGKRLAVQTWQPPVGQDGPILRRRSQLRIHRRAFLRDRGRDVEGPILHPRNGVGTALTGAHDDSRTTV